ncbi:arrestin domain-containing protein 3-like [Asterias rubens]|uniref:arrestin domain-containing protein 3-like n=1 Tax=Asterias rubens TaxID=7604 RepID=UPI0014557DCB|nr:arrestin domain-containing protein 3-like [Asterias rubens]
MSRLRTLAIAFDSNTNVFSSGDVISGQVIVQVDSNRDQEGLKNVQGIWVKFKGKAKTKWTTTKHSTDSDGNSHSHTRTHTKKERYFDTIFVIFGKGKHQRSANKLNIPPGTHAYPFSFQLPIGMLPSPFEHKYGYVRYKVKTTLSLIRTFSNKTFKREKLFSVTGPMVDLNLIPQAQSGVERTMKLVNCCGCGSTVEESITVGLPKQGYVPGESIYLTGQVDNRDREESCDFHAKFMQRITFYSKSIKTKHVDNILGAVNVRVATPRGRVTDFSLGPMPIPPVPPTGLPGCNIIDIEYSIQCKGANGKLKFPIVIGTVPLRARTPASLPTAPPASMPYPSAIATAPDYPKAMAASAPPFGGEAPPPSYEEAVGKTERLANARNDEDYVIDDQFVPSYPYFNLSVDVPPGSRH